MQFDKSRRLYDQAVDLVAGGVSSQFRAHEPAGFPLFFDRAKGSYMWDVDGNKCIDYVMGLGPNLFGHAPEFIIQYVHEEIQRGFVFSAQHVRELELAELALSMIPIPDALVRFASSGTEIDQLAIRLMRGFTGRPKYIKFEGHYHGWADNVSYSTHPPLNQVGSPFSPAAIPESVGIDPLTSENILICEWNDLDKLKQVFKKHPGQIAGVLMEPILGNSNTIIPRPGYLEDVKALCHLEGALLCFDEVITGFRVAKGGAQELLSVTPDLATYAKSLAGGFPIAMLVGRRELMDLIGNGRVVHGGSFNSNLISVAAAYASLEHIQHIGPSFYNELNERGYRLMDGFRRVAKEVSSNLHVQGPGSFFSISFTDRPEILNWRDHARNCDNSKYLRFAKQLIKEGVRLSSIGRVHMASTHTNEDIDYTIEAARRVLQALV